MDVAHTEQDCREEKERLKTKKKKERIAERVWNISCVAYCVVPT